MRAIKVALAAAAVVAVAPVACGCGTATSKPATVRPATPVTVPSGPSDAVLNAELGTAYPVVAATNPPKTCTVTVGSVSAAQSLPAQDEPPKQGWYVTFTVTFKATSEGVQPGGGFAFSVREADGTRYDVSAVYAGPGSDTLPNSTLHQGEVERGTITADVPSPHGILAYGTAYEAGPSQVEWPF